MAGSHNVAQAGWNSWLFLPQCPKQWNDRPVPLCLEVSEQGCSDTPQRGTVEPHFTKSLGD